MKYSIETIKDISDRNRNISVIPDTEAVVRNAIRLAKNYVIVSVPSKPDDNPEHIHLFTNEDLKRLFLENGCAKVKFMSVTNHHVMVAYLK